MAARNRPRSQLKEEVDEERTLWSQIRADAKRADQLIAQSNAASKRIVELSEEQSALIARGDSPSSKIDAELEKNLRENIRLTEEIQNLIESESGSNDILKQLEILTALRDAHEPEPLTSTPRAPSVKRDRPNKRKPTEPIDDRDSITTIDSPPVAGPSPKVIINTAKRFLTKDPSSRGGSVPLGREGSVKAEDGADGDTPSAKGRKSRSTTNASRSKRSAREKARLHVNTEVLYRNNKSRSLEGEGILCRVTSVIGEGKQRRYEIIDSDPDPPVPAVPYRASVNHLVAIPPTSTNTTLPDLPTKRPVLALYPGTTTFYKAEVVANWTKKGGIKEEGKEEIDNLVRLRFEGEDEADREMNVERRYVLPDK
ncbi:hypothetical protein P154DRAFT_542528 [Amniculicola lignicola CBS 123094]|uniref:SGF29 C-terminal domain-containing protein n=1 Tax=Amniculicola lignicola CBS 123094 TaxID=1392246 RepID=A0A6A5WX39_9PLEO|nr:hypothetical protein P154DRAFT_542528 [Amniculicola lignicola CBS 123094]